MLSRFCIENILLCFTDAVVLPFMTLERQERKKGGPPRLKRRRSV
jgi:hypothetical protein